MIWWVMFGEYQDDQDRLGRKGYDGLCIHLKTSFSSFHVSHLNQQTPSHLKIPSKIKTGFILDLSYHTDEIIAPR